VLFTNATTSLVATSAPQDGAGQSTPIIQSTVGVQALSRTAREAPTGDEIAAAFNTADQSQTENPQPPAEALFKQYQAWGGRGRCTDTGPATTARTRCPSIVRAKCPSPGPALTKAPTGPARAKAPTGPDRVKRPGTGPVRAKCPGTVARAKQRWAPLDLAGSEAYVAKPPRHRRNSPFTASPPPRDP
jgi:hypothetical protein